MTIKRKQSYDSNKTKNETQHIQGMNQSENVSLSPISFPVSPKSIRPCNWRERGPGDKNGQVSVHLVFLFVPAFLLTNQNNS